MFDSQKVVDANFVASFDTPYTDLCDEIVEEFEKKTDEYKQKKLKEETPY